tara:strand:- start:5993 stop:6745 length:753 start_codon:yes stop_codon:yes gene_type:complete
MKLENKVALVTGAGQGVGQGIAFELARAGAKVAVAGRTLEKLEASCRSIIESGGEAIPIQCDVKSQESLQSCVQAVIDQYGGINILVNNAQEVPLGTLLELEEEQLNSGWESGPLATLRLMKLCYPHLKGDGVIINLGTAAGKRWDMSGYGAYAACKEAIRSLSRAAACEWGPDGIRTNVIMPLAASPALAWWIDNRPEEAEQFMQSVPQRRVGDCEADIGRFVAMLCGPDSAYVNGQSIGLDGGQAFLG